MVTTKFALTSNKRYSSDKYDALEIVDLNFDLDYVQYSAFKYFVDGVWNY